MVQELVLGAQPLTISASATTTGANEYGAVILGIVSCFIGGRFGHSLSPRGGHPGQRSLSGRLRRPP